MLNNPTPAAPEDIWAELQDATVTFYPCGAGWCLPDINWHFSFFAGQVDAVPQAR